MAQSSDEQWQRKVAAVMGASIAALTPPWLATQQAAGGMQHAASGKWPVMATRRPTSALHLFFRAIKTLPALEVCHKSCIQSQQIGQQVWQGGVAGGRMEGMSLSLSLCCGSVRCSVIFSRHCDSFTRFKERRQMELRVRLGICSRNA